MRTAVTTQRPPSCHDHARGLAYTQHDGKDVRTATPLAAIHLANGRFWVIQKHGYVGETYVLADIAQTRTQYLVEAGRWVLTRELVVPAQCGALAPNSELGDIRFDDAGPEIE